MSIIPRKKRTKAAGVRDLTKALQDHLGPEDPGVDRGRRNGAMLKLVSRIRIDAK